MLLSEFLPIIYSVCLNGASFAFVLSIITKNVPAELQKSGLKGFKG